MSSGSRPIVVGTTAGGTPSQARTLRSRAVRRRGRRRGTPEGRSCWTRRRNSAEGRRRQCDHRRVAVRELDIGQRLRALCPIQHAPSPVQRIPCSGASSTFLLPRQPPSACATQVCLPDDLAVPGGISGSQGGLCLGGQHDVANPEAHGRDGDPRSFGNLLDGHSLRPQTASKDTLLCLHIRQHTTAVGRCERSGRPGSNRRHSAWKADALPTELHPRGSSVARCPR